MRLKITKSLRGEIDGVALDHFRVGETYEVGTTLGSYLLALGAAVPVFDERPVPTIPIEDVPTKRRRQARNRKRRKTAKTRR